MNKQETTIILKCDCGCSMLVVEKCIWDNNEVNYSISVQDSRYDHNYTTLWGRIKSVRLIAQIEKHEEELKSAHEQANVDFESDVDRLGQLFKENLYSWWD